MRILFPIIILLAGCAERVAETPGSRSNASPFAGKPSSALIYARLENGKHSFLCSAAYVTVEGSPARAPGILTASHCLFDAPPDVRGYDASFDEGESFVKLGKAWLGDRFSGADIGFVELDAPVTSKAGSPTPVPLSLRVAGVAEGEQVWTWGNPENRGLMLSVGRIMNANYRQKPIEGMLGGRQVTIDLRGYHVVDISTGQGSSGGLLFANGGVIGVLSSDFRHDSGFKTTFVTPIARLAPVLSQPPSEVLPSTSPQPAKP